jgi:hypothetical protein
VPNRLLELAADGVTLLQPKSHFSCTPLHPCWLVPTKHPTKYKLHPPPKAEHGSPMSQGLLPIAGLPNGLFELAAEDVARLSPDNSLAAPPCIPIGCFPSQQVFSTSPPCPQKTKMLPRLQRLLLFAGYFTDLRELGTAESICPVGPDNITSAATSCSLI